MIRTVRAGAGWLPSRAAAAAAAAWLAVLAVLTCIHFVVTRACGYEQAPVLAYAGYFGLQIVLPGIVVLAALNRGPVSLTQAIALGVPTGFAIEVASFLALSALGARGMMSVLPVLWLGGGALLWRRRGAGLVRWRMTARHAGVALALSVVFFATVMAAVSNMFVESPLIAGLPQRPIFHDWVFLISRAASIKHHWPLEDPSLAGTLLQYHYFMLVHAASASAVTGLEITQLLLRLIVIPLGGVLVVQAYALGRMISRSAWGGVIAALLTVAGGEMAFTAQMNESVFLGRFVRWLFVSPTFYFGMIFFGALLLVLARWREMPRMSVGHIVWLWLLAAGTTGAKGTVVPVLLAALGLWAAWRWLRSGRLPGRLLVAAGCLVAGFWPVYHLTMAKWGTGAAGFAPLDIFEVSGFWRQQLPVWQAWLGGWMPTAWAGRVAGVGLAAAVVVGTMGVRLLAIPFVLGRHLPARRPGVEWLAAAALCSGAMGVLMKLDADGELYLFLMMRLPTSALAAAFAVGAVRGLRLGKTRAENTDTAGAAARIRSRRALGWVAAGVCALVLGVQLSVWVKRHEPGLAGWSRTAPVSPALPGMAQLHEAVAWVRAHTEVDALLIANAFTPQTMKKDHWGAVDGTLAGVHYYYSALAERRLLVEGPLYLLDPAEVTRRMELAGQVFHERRKPTADMFGGGPCYVLLDRSLGDGAAVALEPADRVFANERIEIYRLRDTRSSRSPVVATAP